jgi:hypothetical protein
MRPAYFRINYNHSLARGLRLAFLGAYNGSSRVYDSSLYRRHGVTQNMPEPYHDSELQRGAFRYTRSLSQYVILYDIPIFSGDFTLANWVNVTDEVWQRHYQWSLEAADDTEHRIQLANNESAGGVTTWRVESVANWGAAEIFASDSNAATGQWVHLAVRRKGSTLTLWVDGDLQTATGTEADEYTWTDGGAPVFYLGRRSSGIYFDGKMCDNMLWVRALNPSEISRLANPANYMLDNLIVPIGNIYDLEGIR